MALLQLLEEGLARGGCDPLGAARQLADAVLPPSHDPTNLQRPAALADAVTKSPIPPLHTQKEKETTP